MVCVCVHISILTLFILRVQETMMQCKNRSLAISPRHTHTHTHTRASFLNFLYHHRPPIHHTIALTEFRVTTYAIMYMQRCFLPPLPPLPPLNVNSLPSADAQSWNSENHPAWANHADILTLSRLPVNVKFIFLQRLLSAAMKSERPATDMIFPWMSRLDTNAIILESYFKGPVCQELDPATGESRCKVFPVDPLDADCSILSLSSSSQSIRSALDVLSWGTGLPLQITKEANALAKKGSVAEAVCFFLTLDHSTRFAYNVQVSNGRNGDRKVPGVPGTGNSLYRAGKLHNAQEQLFFKERRCLYPHLSFCPDHGQFSIPPEQPKNSNIRYVFVAGIEGAGHHLVGAMAKAIIWKWGVSRTLLEKYNYKFRNFDPKIFLQGAFPLYSHFSMNKKIPAAWSGQSVFFQAESYPMGMDKLNAHPDLYTFSRLTAGKPVAIFVRRELSAATLSLLRRYGKRRVKVGRSKNESFQFTAFDVLHKELESKETSAILVEHSYQELCTGDTPMLECYELTFEHICSLSASKEQQRAGFVAVASALGIPPSVAANLDWSGFESPCKVHGDDNGKKGKRRKKALLPPPPPPPPGVPPPPPVSMYDLDALKYATDFARGRSGVAIHAATPHNL